jgi:spermidine synthase
LRAGVVGLGAGSLACHAQTGETWRMFELDPLVVRVAADEKLFRFMSRCLPGNEVVVGDARLTLRSEPDRSMDLLIVDAFSSDAIPAHLLTREAMEMYFGKVVEGGLVAIHVTNRHLDLGPSIAATAAALPGVRAIDVTSRPAAAGLDTASARVVFLTRNPDLAERIEAWPDARPLLATGAEPWTDDYSDLLSAILHKLRG